MKNYHLNRIINLNKLILIPYWFETPPLRAEGATHLVLKAGDFIAAQSEIAQLVIQQDLQYPLTD